MKSGCLWRALTTEVHLVEKNENYGGINRGVVGGSGKDLTAFLF